MKFVDTRNDKELQIDSLQAILAGKISAGLLTPRVINRCFTEENLNKLRQLNFSDLATQVLSAFLDDISQSKIAEMVKLAYSTDNFDAELPLCNLGDNLFSLEQWHGRTAAFKDIALSLLPYLIQEALRQEDSNLRILMLGATSGDTGSAGEAGFHNIPEVFVSILFPEEGKVSLIQKEQMLRFQTDDGRVSAYSILGNFDFCQNNIVKPLLEDKDFREELLEKYKIQLSSLNSINIGRIAAQIISFFKIYQDLGEKFDICVPSGNFGHILSAYFTKKMGLPIRKLIVASNENDVLHRFIQSGVYAPKEFKTTNSPSMDIVISSNLERLLFYLAGAKKTKKWLEELREQGSFTVDTETLEKLQADFSSGFASEKETLAEIKQIWSSKKRILDPHSAVASFVARRQQEQGVPMVFTETAHWSKFSATICEALELNYIDDLQAIQDVEQLIQQAKGMPLCPLSMQNFALSDKKARCSNFRPDLEEMKEQIRRQIEGD